MRIRRRSGQAMVEFAFTSIFLIFILMSLYSMSVGMWQYHTLAEAVNVTARTAAVHGAGCVGKSCATTVDQIARTLKARALGIPVGQINATLTSSASTVTCNPLSTCVGNSAAWPTLAGNTALTTNISVTATVQFTDPVSVWVPGHGTQRIAPVTFGANSTQPVIF
jgi:Flp pilus assembly protein TadG